MDFGPASLGAILSSFRMKSPSPAMYFVFFFGSAIVAEITLFVMLGTSVGYRRSFSILMENLASPMGIGIPVLGGILGTSIFWFPRR